MPGASSLSDELLRHLVTPVQWRSSQHTLVALGATAFIEVGPGPVLAGLAKRTVPDVTVTHIGTPSDVDGFVAGFADAPIGGSAR